MKQIAQLSLPAFDVLWEGLNAGGVPYPFDINVHGDTLDERARIKQAVLTDLERKNLTRRGRPEPDLEDALNLLARPELRVIAMCMPNLEEERIVRATVVARGGYAVLAVQDEQNVTLNLLRTNEIAASLANVVPPGRPGPGKPVTVPGEAFEKPQEQQQGFRQQVRSTENDDVRLAKQMLTGPAIGNGHFLVIMEQGRTKKNFPPVTWIDTRAGRYANVPARTGWYTITPADNAVLARHLSQVLSMTSER